jgi:uncharacterized protein
VQIFMQLAAGIYMICVALNLLDVHPVFRYVVIQPPRFATRLVKKQSRSAGLFAPFLLGLLTILIPCATTLAMETLAISHANPLTGALIMGAFVLGTAPLFLGIGYISSLMNQASQKWLFKIAAIAILYIGLTSINGALVSLNSPLSMQSIAKSMLLTEDTTNVEVTQNQRILITARGYTPSYIRVQKNKPVTLELKSQDAFTCASAFRIPALGIEKNLQPNDTQTVTFTPAKAGKIQFNCSMGMYTGTIEVI